MIKFFIKSDRIVYAVEFEKDCDKITIEKLHWLFSNATISEQNEIPGKFIGPRKEMITPWSTNAVEITQNMGITGIRRIEEFYPFEKKISEFDPMLQAIYDKLDQNIFKIERDPEPVMYIENIEEYNDKEGLALSKEEIEYLKNVSKILGRPLTDSEIFGFSQVNSEHCRHKIFNGTFIIDGKEKKYSLFELIKKTTFENPNRVISAYKDNCAFIKGPVVEQFAPRTQDKPDFFDVEEFESVISLKAETHNFPTTVEPFNGAATGTGGEIRDRIAGGKGAIPIAGTAVYMTSYPRLSEERIWEKNIKERKWLYHNPKDILIKASNGASDFGNKFGQPLICGSVLTFEHEENNKIFGYDKVIMLAGGIGFGKLKDSKKDTPEKEDKIILLGGDNYRIGMGGGAVSSVATGEYDKMIELNAVQRSNPEMQKRIFNAIRALIEKKDSNPIISIHDHGAGGHLNCISELVEKTGGYVDMDKLPIGDPTLSAKEIIGNESQERIGLILKNNDIELLKKIAERERAPMYVIGKVTGDNKLTFESKKKNEKPIDIELEYLFGKPPKTIIKDSTLNYQFDDLNYDVEKFLNYLEQILQLEAVACKDWLTNKVDRSVTGKIVQQQTVGELQLPLSNLAIASIDYRNKTGIATSIGHAPISGLIDPSIASRLAIAEALTNIIWTPIEEGIKGISLSANWMWPCKNPGEDSRLYQAVEAASDFARKLKINIPTGKDSLSMTQKYPDGKIVISPGTVIISAVAQVIDYTKTINPVLKKVEGSYLYYIDFSLDEFYLGGSSFAQILNKIGRNAPDVKDPIYFAKVFEIVQELIKQNKIIAGHDVSSGGLITTLLEMNFPNTTHGMKIDLSEFPEKDPIKILFCEKPAIIIQTQDNQIEKLFDKNSIKYYKIGEVIKDNLIKLKVNEFNIELDIPYYRDIWYKTSFLLDQNQSGKILAKKRYENYKNQPLYFEFPENFKGTLKEYNINLNKNRKIKAAIIREKGVNGDREMAYSLYLAGFDVKDVHMTDLVSGRETLEDINFIVFVGGFSNSDVLGSAKGWAGAFIYNPLAKQALENFYKREDTLSLGVCNGCQLMIELGLINPEHKEKPKMLFNDSHKFESSFLNVIIPENNSIMLHSLAGSRLGIWIAHGEGKFYLPYDESKYHIPMKYAYSEYPGNPNGSFYNTAALCSADGRHLAMMPHIERSIFPWNWAYYPENRKNDEVSPWIEAFVNALEWIKKIKK